VGYPLVKQYGFNQIERFPLAGATREQVLAYRFPMERFEDLLGLMLPVVSARGQYWIGCDVSPASSRCTGGCAAWRTLCWISRQPALAEQMFGAARISPSPWAKPRANGIR